MITNNCDCTGCEGLEEIIADKTVSISGNELERYKGLLNDSRIDSLKNIEIDNRGYSKEIAEILGKGYMQDRMFIVTTEQQNASCINEGYSFMPVLMKGFYESWGSKLNLFLKNEPLIGKLEIGVKKEENAKIEVYSEFDTPNKDVADIRKTITEIEAITENPKLILKSKYMKDLLKKTQELNTKYDSIKNLSKELFTVKKEMIFFRYDELYYVLDKKDEELGLTEINMSNGKKPDSVNCKIINSIKKDYKTNILNKFLELGLIEPDKEKIKQRMKEMQEKVISELLTEKDKPVDVFSYYHFINKPEVREMLPKEWYDLRKALDEEVQGINPDLMLDLLNKKINCKLLDEVLEGLR